MLKRTAQQLEINQNSSMKNRPALGHHKITVFGQQIEIFVCGHISGNTTAFRFKFRSQKEATFMPKSHRRFVHLMQFYDEIGELEGPPQSGWGIAHPMIALRLYPVTNPSWETTGKIYS